MGGRITGNAVVLVFLRQIRGTLIIGLAIPSLIAYAVLFMMDYSINMMTLFAMIVAIGMVVDNAIVVLENIASHREQGETLRRAIYGASEVGMAVVASTLTTFASFSSYLCGRYRAIILHRLLLWRLRCCWHRFLPR